MEEIKPCPFCGGKAKVHGRQHKFFGRNAFGNVKISWTLYVACNKCHSRGLPVKTKPLKMNDDEKWLYDVGNFYSTDYWCGQGKGFEVATENFRQYADKAIAAWNGRT